MDEALVIIKGTIAALLHSPPEGDHRAGAGPGTARSLASMSACRPSAWRCSKCCVNHATGELHRKMLVALDGTRLG
jgi:hypothetical protein